MPYQGVTAFIRDDRNSPEKRLIGYARVSTYGQTLDAQLEQLRTDGERSHQTLRAGRDVAGIGGQLRPQHIHYAPRHARGLIRPSE